jgi:E-phenylitaconyl-CoA hydratase
LILRAIKEITIRDPEMNSEERLRFAETLSKQLRQRAGAKEGLTTFREKRQPAWQGS